MTQIFYVATQSSAREGNSVTTYYLSIQATRYPRIVTTQEKLCSDINQTTLAELCHDIAKLCCDKIQEESIKNVATETACYDKVLGDRDENYVVIELYMS